MTLGRKDRSKDYVHDEGVVFQGEDREDGGGCIVLDIPGGCVVLNIPGKEDVQVFRLSDFS